MDSRLMGLSSFSSFSISFSRRLITIALVLITWFPKPTVAWSAQGHRLVVEMALSLVEPDVVEYFEAIAPQIDGDWGYASSWADFNKDYYRWTDKFHYSTAIGSFKEAQCSYVDQLDCAEGQCVVGALTNYTDQLMSCSSAEDPEFVVRMAIHLIADINQPLHVAGDVGGNRIMVRNYGETTSLHKVWDGEAVKVGLRDLNLLRLSPSRIAEELLSLFGDAEIERVDGTSRTRKLQHTVSFVNAAIDANKLVCSDVYALLDTRYDIQEQNQYLHNMGRIAIMQLVRSAYMLADVFESTFGCCSQTDRSSLPGECKPPLQYLPENLRDLRLPPFQVITGAGSIMDGPEYLEDIPKMDEFEAIRMEEQAFFGDGNRYPQRPSWIQQGSSMSIDQQRMRAVNLRNERMSGGRGGDGQTRGRWDEPGDVRLTHAYKQTVGDQNVMLSHQQAMRNIPMLDVDSDSDEDIYDEEEVMEDSDLYEEPAIRPSHMEESVHDTYVESGGWVDDDARWTRLEVNNNKNERVSEQMAAVLNSQMAAQLTGSGRYVPPHLRRMQGVDKRRGGSGGRGGGGGGVWRGSSPMRGMRSGSPYGRSGSPMRGMVNNSPQQWRNGAGRGGFNNGRRNNRGKDRDTSRKW